MSELKPLYLIAGSDGAKIDSTRSRLRARAERQGGVAALLTLEPVDGRGSPDHEALLAAIPAMSLTEERRYVLVDGIERWGPRQQESVAAALGSIPPDLTVVLIARAKAPAKIRKAVAAAAGEIHEFEAPSARELPPRLVAEARRRGFELDSAAARMLVQRMGANPARLGREVERLALWAEGGTVGVEELASMVADTSEAAVWSLSDAVIEGDTAAALGIAERLVGQGESVTGLVYGLASRLRAARGAAERLERGEAPRQIESSLGMHPYAARQLVARVRDADVEALRSASAALADLEVQCRGGAEYGDDLALTLALRRATT